jgi:hypothetical protein
MGGGGDEHIGRAGASGSGTWDEDWEESEYGEDEGELYGERGEVSNEDE